MVTANGAGRDALYAKFFIFRQKFPVNFSLAKKRNPLASCRQICILKRRNLAVLFHFHVIRLCPAGKRCFLIRAHFKCGNLQNSLLLRFSLSPPLSGNGGSILCPDYICHLPTLSIYSNKASSPEMQHICSFQTTGFIFMFFLSFLFHHSFNRCLQSHNHLVHICLLDDKRRNKADDVGTGADEYQMLL